MESNLGIRTILVPYDSGHRSARMGNGPEHLLDSGLRDELQANLCKVQSTTVESQSSLPAEVATAFELDRLIAEETRSAVETGEFPLVLSGNCNSSVGSMSGVGAENLGIVWFDAHADFNTPETTTTGFSDAVVGADFIRKTGVVDALGAALDALRGRVDRVYVHLDLDVLDPEKVGSANEFAAPLGLVAEEVEEAIQMIHERFVVAAAGIASYDPAFDTGGAVLRAGCACARALVHSDGRG